METETTATLMTHLTSGAVVVYAIEYLKRIPQLRWITQQTGTINALLSAMLAALISLGITWQGSAAEGWTIHIPMLSMITASIWEWAKQFVLQQLLYDGAVQKRRAITAPAAYTHTEGDR